MAATSAAAASASANADFASVPTRSRTCLGLRPHSRANRCQSLPSRYRPDVLPAILCASFLVTFSQTSPHMTSYIGASDAPLPRIMIE